MSFLQTEQYALVLNQKALHTNNKQAATVIYWSFDLVFLSGVSSS